MEIKQKIQTWEKELKEITAQFKNAFGQLPEETLNRKPAPKSWSIAENMEHLIKANESYYPVIKAIRNGTQALPFVAKFSFLTNLLGKFLLKAVAPDRGKKVKTFPIWEPQNSTIKGDIVERFEKHQQQLIAFIKNAEDLLQKETVISSPANKLIVYKLDKAFDILVSHEKRHYNQALEVLNSLKG
jgi:hypothetical protein